MLLSLELIQMVSYGAKSHNLMSTKMVLQAIMKRRERLKIVTRAKSVDLVMVKKAKDFERDLMNLALLPSNWIPEAFSILKQKLQIHHKLYDIMSPLFTYYDKFWLKKVKPNIFSVFQRKRRTNNVIERYHRTLKELISTNPEILRFVGKTGVSARSVYFKVVWAVQSSQTSESLFCFSIETLRIYRRFCNHIHPSQVFIILRKKT